MIPPAPEIVAEVVFLFSSLHFQNVFNRKQKAYLVDESISLGTDCSIPGINKPNKIHSDIKPTKL